MKIEFKFEKGDHICMILPFLGWTKANNKNVLFLGWIKYTLQLIF